jgi:hypothetical protein
MGKRGEEECGEAETGEHDSRRRSALKSGWEESTGLFKQG